MALSEILSDDDLTPFADVDPAKAAAMVTHALALTAVAAPCLKTTTDEDVIAAAKAILVGVVLRWHESGTASYQAQVTGPPGYPVSPQRERRNMLWPSEVEDLQALCVDAGASSSVYSLDLAGPEADTTALDAFGWEA